MTEKKKKERYQSKDGFTEVKVLRGFTEINNLYQFVQSTKGQYYFCGGYIRWMCSPHPNPSPANDIDIYCKDKQSFEILAKDFSESINFKLEIRYENDISLTYKKPSNSKHPLFASPPIQLIKPIREARLISNGTMEDIINSFDFTIIRIALLSQNYALADADFLHDEAKKIIRIKNIHCPISSTYRVIKYVKRDYWIQTFQMWRLFNDWEQRDDEYKQKIGNFLMNQNPSQEEINELEALMRID